MCQIVFTEITYLQFCCLQIIPATETETKTQKNLLRAKNYHVSIKFAQNKELSRFDKMKTELAHLNYSPINTHL